MRLFKQFPPDTATLQDLSEHRFLTVHQRSLGDTAFAVVQTPSADERSPGILALTQGTAIQWEIKFKRSKLRETPHPESLGVEHPGSSRALALFSAEPRIQPVYGLSTPMGGDFAANFCGPR